MILNCPLPTALTTIPMPTCPFRFDQLVRLALQRRQPAGTPPFVDLEAIQTLLNWTTFKAAADATKIVTTPIFASTVIPASEGLTTGGNDNSTFNGIRQYNGEGAVTVTGQFSNLPAATYRALELLSQESLAGSTGISNLTAYLFNRDGYSFQINPVDGAGAATTIYRGIPVYNFRVSSPGSEGFNAPNINNFSFDLPADWARYISSVKPDFDVLSEI
jgi:hypothetical protein